MENKNRPVFALTEEEFLGLFDSRYEKKNTNPNQEEIRKDELLTQTEVCALFKKTRQTIRSWTNKKFIKAIVIGGSNFYSKIEIENYLNRKFNGFTIGSKK